VKFACIEAEKATTSISMMCRMLRVSRAGFYAWSRRTESTRARRNRELTMHIAAIHEESRRTYGSPRVHAELRFRGRQVSVNRVARLMQAAGIRARRRRRFVVTTTSRHNLPVAANVLERDFRAHLPNRVWSTDITYVPTREGWLYLAVVEDLFSRRIVGWATATSLERQLPLAALEMAIALRVPEAGLLHHSDRGSQYASFDYQKVLERHGIRCSMSRRGNCLDNAPVESFFGTLKNEHVHHFDFETVAQARAEVIDYIENFYNPRRRHSALGYRSPVEYEVETKRGLVA
jgi:putative transposase